MTTHRSAALAVLVLVLFTAAPARGQTPEPYRDPPFTCSVIDYGTDPPTLPAPPNDPLCVRYDKTNITGSTLEVVDFLAAEPGRVAIVAGKCSYWQQDHWIVRASPDTAPLVSWEGSYWYDARTGSAAGILRDLRVADQPADAGAFIAALRPVVGDAVADQLGTFAYDGGGGGASFALPEGFGGDPCTASAEPPPAAGEVDDPAEPPAPGEAAGSPALPATGTRDVAGMGLVLLVLAGALQAALRAAR